MKFLNSEDTQKIVSQDPQNWIEFAGVYRTQEFIDTMIHRVPDADVVNRKDFIKQICRDKKNIHLGCRGQSKEPNAFHGELTSICSEVWGVDIQECDIPNFVLVDLDKPGWPDRIEEKSFDYILATEILEHLSNPGMFLDGCRSFGCDVILTVPNAFDHNRYSIMRKGIEYDNGQHVAYYSFNTIKVLSGRHGFQIIDFLWADSLMQYFSKGLIFVLSPV